jgi:hypothetical protein
MSGMEFGERDLMPGEAMTGKTEWEDALIKHGIQEAQTVQKTDDDLHQDDVERKEQMVSGWDGRAVGCACLARCGAPLERCIQLT